MTGFDSHIRRVAVQDQPELIPCDGESNEGGTAQALLLEQKIRDDDLAKLTLKIHAMLDDTNQAITITGLGDSRGGSYISLKIAQAFAKFHPNQKILIIDVDLNAPKLHDEFNVSMSPGLMEVLQSQSSIDEALAFSGSPGLYVLPAGENKAQISNQVLLYNLTTLLPKLKAIFSMILLSAPDISTSFEAELSASQSDSVIVVVKSGETSKPKLREIDAQIHRAGAKFFGIVLSR